MPKVQFSDLDSTGKRAVCWLANEAKTVTSFVTAAAAHVGEVWEAAAFMKQFPEGTTERAMLAERLQLGDRGAESIAECIKRAAPGHPKVSASAGDNPTKFARLLIKANGNAMRPRQDRRSGNHKAP